MKKLLLFLFLLAVAPLAMQAQTREIYTNTNFKILAQGHKTLAILPFVVKLQLRPQEVAKNGGPEGVAKLEQREGLDVQQALHSYFLKQKSANDLTVDVQDPTRTNALMAQSGLTPEQLAIQTPEQLALLLGVDGIISGTFASTQPMSNGAAIALNVMVGISGPTNTGKLLINIHDGKSGELLWKYDKSLARGFGSDTNTIVTTIMRKASRQFPYSREFKG